MEPEAQKEVYAILVEGLQETYDQGYDAGHKAGLAIAQARYDQGWIDGANAAIARQGHSPLAGS